MNIYLVINHAAYEMKRNVNDFECIRSYIYPGHASFILKLNGDDYEYRFDVVGTIIEKKDNYVPKLYDGDLLKPIGGKLDHRVIEKCAYDLNIDKTRITGLTIINEKVINNLGIIGGNGQYLLCIDNQYCFEYTLSGTCYYPSTLQLLHPKHFENYSFKQTDNKIDKKSFLLQIAIGTLKAIAQADL